MSGLGKLISKPGDFPRVKVYLRPGPQGAVFTLAFRNLEYIEKFTPGSALLIVLVVAGVPGAGFLADYVQGATGIPWYYAFAAGIGVIVFAWFKLKNPRRTQRAIELDFGADALRVAKNGRIEAERPLSRLANLTVEDHPDAEFARQDRQMRGEKGLKAAEKQHCLMGWFGAGGAEQVPLVYRAEWPNRNSLFQVRQAMLWAKALGEQAGDAGAADGAAPAGAAGGIKPPLD